MQLLALFYTIVKLFMVFTHLFDHIAVVPKTFQNLVNLVNWSLKGVVVEIALFLGDFEPRVLIERL